MDFLIHIINTIARDIIWDFIFFYIGYAVLQLLSLGTFPKDEDLNKDHEIHGRPWGAIFGSHHGFVCFIGGVTFILIWLMIVIN